MSNIAILAILEDLIKDARSELLRIIKIQEDIIKQINLLTPGQRTFHSYDNNEKLEKINIKLKNAENYVRKIKEKVLKTLESI